MNDAINVIARQVMAQQVADRNVRRRLNISPDGLTYLSKWTFRGIPQDPHARALYVGVGHGHDALTALLEGRIGQVVGVDPYVATDGNDDEDYARLTAVLRELGLIEQFRVQRCTIQEFLASERGLFDVVMCADVLHHIFVESAPLSKRPSVIMSLSELMGALGERVKPGGHLIITEICRHGLRPWLCRLGIMRRDVTYDTKHSWREWHRGMPPAVWELRDVATYVPLALQKWQWLLGGTLGRVTASDRFRLTYKRRS